MKALTLHQPWAQLVAIGAKRIETRSWSTSYRGPLAIHAGAQHLHHGRFFLLARRARTGGLIDAETEAMFRALAVPFGAVVATCRLVDVVPIAAEPAGDACVAFDEDGLIRVWHRFEVNPGGGGWWGDETTEEEAAFGDFTPGRFAWLLADVEPLAEPVPARGHQRLWEWDQKPEVMRTS